MARLKTLKGIRKKGLQQEVETRKKCGCTKKPLLQCILHDLFEPISVSMSKYYGGKMEEPSCRQLCLRGIAFFKDVSALIKLFLSQQNIHIPPNKISNEAEVTSICINHGRLCVIMDKLFLDFNLKGDIVNNEKVLNIEKKSRLHARMAQNEAE